MFYLTISGEGLTSYVHSLADSDKPCCVPQKVAN